MASRLMSHGKAAQRDIVQFVPFRKFKTVRLLLIFVLQTERQATVVMKSIILSWNVIRI